MIPFEGCINYRLLEKEHLSDINATAFTLVHEKTGAKVCLLQNDDKNKSFIIGFKTPESSSTGVAHILEHSVLCGSEHFPVKDAMTEVGKGSLNTFLNAYTYPDRTLYPVSSCNDADFKNLCHVYLDAVFYPRVHKDERIFKQEGWHYELKDADDELKINGVVYNEMKGVYSSPDQALSSYLMFSLFPDTQYGFESGGDPDTIPDLSYEDFLSFHKKYYHPSNSRIYLYGDMDFCEMLNFIDEEYLSKFDEIGINSEVKLQSPFKAPVRLEKTYSLSEDSEEENGTFLTYNVVCSDYSDIKTTEIMNVINYALCSVPGAKLKERLIDAGIGTDVYSTIETDVCQKFFSIVAENAKAEDEEKFVRIIEDTIKEIISEGFDKKTLEASITSSEFVYREADFATFPKGIAYGMMIFDQWNYSNNDIFNSLKSNAIYKELRNGINEGLFEKTLEERVLNNTHKTIFVFKPEKGLQARKDEAFKEEMRSLKNSFSKEQILDIVRETQELKAYQEEADSEEALATIPHLKLSDMEKETERFDYEITDFCGVREVKIERFTNGIIYACLGFNINSLPEKYYPALCLLKILLGFMDTENYKYGDFVNEVNIVSGGLSGTYTMYPDGLDPDKYNLDFEVRFKSFYNRIEDCFKLINELLFTTKYDNKKRIKELLLESKTRIESFMMQSGHVVAIQRGISYFDSYSAINDKIAGYSQYLTIVDMIRHFDERIDTLIAEMKEVMKLSLNKKNLILCITGEERGISKFNECARTFLDSLDSFEDENVFKTAEYTKKNEAFITPGTVDYLALTGNYRRHGLGYSGRLNILREILSTEYLWTKVRLQGGAYGCMCGFRRNGESFFVSYRDPHARETLEAYKGAVSYIKNFDPQGDELDNYIISTIGSLDTPLTPSLVSYKVYNMLRSGITFDMLQKERDEILSSTPENIRELAKYIEAIVDDCGVVSVGGESIIKRDQDLFMEVKPLIS
jgi:Zn-dependent M16 (insulinase) family peptidase